MQLANFETEEEMIQVTELRPMACKSFKNSLCSKLSKIFFNLNTCNYDADYLHYWVSASDIGHEPGQFFWPGGRKVDSDMWDRNTIHQPNDFGEGKETCVKLGRYSKLIDDPCSGADFFICELGAEFSHCSEPMPSTTSAPVTRINRMEQLWYRSRVRQRSQRRFWRCGVKIYHFADESGSSEETTLY